MCISARSRGETQAESLRFLQSRVAEAVNLNDPSESKEFKALATWLFQPPQPDTQSCPSPSLAIRQQDPHSLIQSSRNQLFEKLCTFFPKSMTPPSQNIMDFVIGQEKF